MNLSPLIFFHLFGFENLKLYKECMGSLALLSPRNFAVFKSQYDLLQYCTQRAPNFTDYLFSTFFLTIYSQFVHSLIPF